ncbi:hypothetical protein PIB30_055568 [Stylosanthes scabra]|uniref:Uncharacterized protein n=1 Tax=Stylosanthes scabra TaxID=79078 RepID=A0ABU6YGJ3_9FABA|nr:hypothetical protein [Stylosanthes scabra]
MVEPAVQVERDTVERLYRLDNITHVAAGINKKCRHWVTKSKKSNRRTRITTITTITTARVGSESSQLISQLELD